MSVHKEFLSLLQQEAEEAIALFDEFTSYKKIDVLLERYLKIELTKTR